MAAKIILIAAILVASLALSSAVKFTDCGSVTGKVATVDVVGCDDSGNPCIVHRGTNASISITFKDLADTAQLKAVVHGIIAGLPVPFDPPQKDACVNSGLQCPLVNGKMYKYTNIIEVKEIYPSGLKVDVKWELQDPTNSKDATCVQFPIELQ